MPDMTKNQPAFAEFEPEFVSGLKAIFEEQVLFNRVLGLKITRLHPDGVGGRIDMKQELVGHFTYQRLHRFGRLGTIDLRIDYLRQAISSHFELSAQVLRLGSRVATTRMEFHDADGKLVSTGSAAYIVS